jgi:hypothetical protein
MRKQGAFIFAALLLFLSACGERPAAPASVQGSAPSLPAEASQGVILPNGTLPLTPYKPLSAPPRLNDEITDTIVPRDDYGRLWPYVGGYAVALWMSGDVLGLCDEQGRIVCDPVYNRAEIIEKDGKRLYKLTENRLDPAGEDVSRITLSKLDGSWAKDYDGVAYKFPGSEYFAGSNAAWRPGIAYDGISVCENGRWGVIDYEGNELLACTYNNPVCFSDGLAAVISDDGQTYTYIDLKGNTILGPYDTPPLQVLNNTIEPITDPLTAELPTQTLRRWYGLHFSGGLARFYKDGKYGLIDLSGKIDIPARYDFIVPLGKGLAEVVTGSSYENFKYSLIDASGRILVEPGNVRIEYTADGTVILDEAQGFMVLDPKTGARTPWVNTDPTTGMSISSGSDGVVIGWDSGETLCVPDAVYAVPLDNGTIALSNGNGTWYITDRSGKKTAGPFDGRADGFWNGFINVSMGMSGVRDGTDTTYRTLYGREGNRVLPEVYREIIPVDGRYLVRQDNVAGLLDEKGNWVIKTPITDYLSD